MSAGQKGSVSYSFIFARVRISVLLIIPSQICFFLVINGMIAGNARIAYYIYIYMYISEIYLKNKE
jgi:hypothetical protein